MNKEIDIVKEIRRTKVRIIQLKNNTNYVDEMRRLIDWQDRLARATMGISKDLISTGSTKNN